MIASWNIRFIYALGICICVVFTWILMVFLQNSESFIVVPGMRKQHLKNRLINSTGNGTISSGIFKQIIWFNDFFGVPHTCVKDPGTCLKQCPENRCTLTDDKTLYRKSDAVIFHLPGLGNSPPVKYPHQAWIILSMESPANYPVIPKKFINKFNWTATYMTTSDIYVPYHVTTELPDVNRTAWSYKDFHKGREKKIFWAVSNCKTISRRESVVKSLRKLGWQIDVYGKCGPNEYPSSDYLVKNLGKSYMFYLAFENSLCKDYITEKPWNAIIKWETIPITYGYGNYTTQLPPNSFIDVNSFPTINSLSDHLHMVADSKDLYNSYFKWRKTHSYGLPTPTHRWICDICKALHDKYHNYYKDMNTWWSPEDLCTSHALALQSKISSLWPSVFTINLLVYGILMKCNVT